MIETVNKKAFEQLGEVGFYLAAAVIALIVIIAVVKWRDARAHRNRYSRRR